MILRPVMRPSIVTSVYFTAANVFGVAAYISVLRPDRPRTRYENFVQKVLSRSRRVSSTKSPAKPVILHVQKALCKWVFSPFEKQITLKPHHGIFHASLSATPPHPRLLLAVSGHSSTSQLFSFSSSSFGSSSPQPPALSDHAFKTHRTRLRPTKAWPD